MAKKKTTHATPPKVFRIPADMLPLQNYSNVLVEGMRNEHRNRMNTTSQQAASERNAVKNSFRRKGKTNRSIKK